MVASSKTVAMPFLIKYSTYLALMPRMNRALIAMVTALLANGSNLER